MNSDTIFYFDFFGLIVIEYSNNFFNIGIVWNILNIHIDFNKWRN